MDKRKLIGTIIGVIMFGALIVGATFAWLTFGVTIDNNSATTAGTMNFSVEYIRGQDINSMQILGTATPSNVTTITTIKANKVAGSAPGTLHLYLNTNAASSDDIMATTGVIRYAVCIGSCTDFSTAAATGTLTSESQKELYTGELPDTQTTYNIYFWLDGETLVNDHLNKSYSGYISAEAKQTGYE